MKKIDRTLLKHLEAGLSSGQAIVVTGPRQAGKTTLINMLLERHSHQDILYLNADDPYLRSQWVHPSDVEIRQMLGQREIVFIDEAQRLEHIGTILGTMLKHHPGLKIIATASSSFDLDARISPALSGRKREYTLFPMTYAELLEGRGHWEEERMLEHRVIYGYYPEVVSSPGREERLVRELADNYIFKDIYSLEQISKPALLENIVRALALHLGREISIIELAHLVDADRATVEKYLEVLQKAWVIFMLPAFHRDLPGEIKKGRKYYFWDNGILNALLGNFNPIGVRPDSEALWQNFAISERIKQARNSQSSHSFYFWRALNLPEIPLIEVAGDKVWAYQIILDPSKTAQLPSNFETAYQVHRLMIASPENFKEYVSGESH